MTTRCARCLLPSTYPGITFDSHGVCTHCRAHAPRDPLGEDLLLERLRSRKGEKYDCVVGISGGKDSCYVAYLAKKQYGLRVLAVCYDFPFMVDLARRNVRTVCDSLGIELIVVESRRDVERSFMRDHLTALSATGTTWGQCMFCHYGIHAILSRTARTRSIPFVLSGVTSSEVWWDPGSRARILAKHLKGLSLADKALFGLYESRAYLKLVEHRRQFPSPGNSRFDAYRHPRADVDGPESIRVFDYVAWDQDLIETTLREETGWQKPDRLLSWRYDCVLEPLLDYTYKREFGISSAGLYLCDLIRSGGIAREEALALLEEIEDQSRLDACLRDVLDSLDIPERVQARFFRASGPTPS